jgi:putative oxidoreductase
MKYISYMINEKYTRNLYFVFRVLVGFGFLMHGYGKLFGAKAAPLFSLMGLAGIIEFFGGLLIVLGLFTTISAILGALTMFVAYFKVHALKAFSPLANGGELALIYFATMLVLIGFGAGAYSLEKKIFGKEICRKKK